MAAFFDHADGALDGLGGADFIASHGEVADEERAASLSAAGDGAGEDQLFVEGEGRGVGEAEGHHGEGVAGEDDVDEGVRGEAGGGEGGGSEHCYGDAAGVEGGDGG